MRRLDSNIVIYATQPGNDWLRAQLFSQPFGVSVVTVVEVLGWHRITPQDKQDLAIFLNAGAKVAVTDAVVRLAVALRQQKKMSLGEIIIAATALEYGCELMIQNVEDFKHVSGIVVTDPFSANP